MSACVASRAFFAPLAPDGSYAPYEIRNIVDRFGGGDSFCAGLLFSATLFDDPQEQMPNTNINITGDVSVVKSDRQSLSDEEREKLRRKYGLTEKELATELEEINGVWQAPEEEEEKDIFVENEQEQ